MVATRKLRISIIVILANVSAGSASAQGFFESLFGAPHEGRSAYTRDSGSWGPTFGEGESRPSVLDPTDSKLHREIRKRTVSRPKPKHDPAAPVIAVDRQPPVAETTDAPRGSLAFFAKDKTLRAGDVIVTDAGFMIYQGGNRDSAKSFVALAKAGPERKGLLALERASAIRNANIQVEIILPQRDFVGPRTAEQFAAENDRKTVATAQ